MVEPYFVGAFADNLAVIPSWSGLPREEIQDLVARFNYVFPLGDRIGRCKNGWCTRMVLRICFKNTRARVLNQRLNAALAVAAAAAANQVAPAPLSPASSSSEEETPSPPSFPPQ